MKTSNNTILITGGASGIGLAIAQKFLENGNTVIICGRRADKLAEVKSRFPDLHTKVADISNPDDRIELRDWVTSNFPGLNILVNNAGIQNTFFLKQQNTIEAITSEVTTNLISPIHLANLFVPHLIKQQEAAIVNITSGLAYIPVVATAVYCATKAALHSFTLSARHQLKDTSIKVFEIAPPIVDTELGNDSSHTEREVAGIQPSQVAQETFLAIQNDQYECAIGMAQNLYQAAHSDKAGIVFNQVNR
jgi:uncharacterized oxidoreductase